MCYGRRRKRRRDGSNMLVVRKTSRMALDLASQNNRQPKTYLIPARCAVVVAIRVLAPVELTGQFCEGAFRDRYSGVAGVLIRILQMWAWDELWGECVSRFHVGLAWHTSNGHQVRTFSGIAFGGGIKPLSA